MKRDHASIDERIKEKGVTKKQVAKACEINEVTLSRIIKGATGYTSADTIKMIHEYLDKVKTEFKLGKDFAKWYQKNKKPPRKKKAED